MDREASETLDGIRQVRATVRMDRLFLVLFMLALIPFAYLLATMEREADLSDRIAGYESRIRENEKRSGDLEARVRVLNNRIDAIEQVRETRELKVREIEFRIKVQEIEQELQLIAAETAQLREKIAAENKKLTELRNKGFLERLLKI